MGLLARLREAGEQRRSVASANRAAQEHIQRGIEASRTFKWSTSIWEFDQAIALATDRNLLARAHAGAFFAHAAKFDRAEAMRHHEILEELDPAQAKRLEATPAFVATNRMGPVIFG